jgi:hypothetical protein
VGRPLCPHGDVEVVIHKVGTEIVTRMSLHLY